METGRSVEKNKWRKENVTPILKAKRRTQGTTRASSLTSNPFKVMDQLNLETIYKNVKCNKIIFIIQDSQHGFTKE